MIDHDDQPGPFDGIETAVPFDYDALDGILDAKPEAEIEQIAELAWRVLRPRHNDLIAHLLGQNPSPHIRLALYQVAFALGLDIIRSRSEQEIADEHGVTRAAVSKGANKIRDLLRIRESEAMRSQENRIRCKIKETKNESR
jgi:hypothetical protein